MRSLNMCDVRTIYCDVERNRFIDDLGYEIANIYRVVDSNMVYLLKTKRQDMFVYGVHGEFIELVCEENT